MPADTWPTCSISMYVVETLGVATAVSLPETPGTSEKRDFLDVDRLRLLSSASSRPATNPRPASSVVLGKDKRRLQAVEEGDDIDVDAPWIHVDQKAERRRRLMDGSNVFQSGDGFNVYVDGARCLPDNVTITKVTAAALHADRSQVPTENGSAFASLITDTFSPSFDMVLSLLRLSFRRF